MGISHSVVCNWVLMGHILVIGYVTLWDTQFVGGHMTLMGRHLGNLIGEGAVIGLIGYVITSHLVHYGKSNTSLIGHQQNENNEVRMESFQKNELFS